MKTLSRWSDSKGFGQGMLNLNLGARVVLWADRDVHHDFIELEEAPLVEQSQASQEE